MDKQETIAKLAEFTHTLATVGEDSTYLDEETIEGNEILMKQYVTFHHHLTGALKAIAGMTKELGKDEETADV